MAELDNIAKKPARVIAISNQKGGVGKTTSTVLIAQGLAACGYKTLVVDCDSSANLTSYFGVKELKEKKIELPELVRKTISYENEEEGALPVDTVPLEDIVYHCDQIDLLGNNARMATVESEMVSAVQRETVLSRIINALFINEYDYILLDSGPSLGLLLLNTLSASTEVLIPVQPERFATEALDELFKTIRNVKKRINSNIKILGIIITMYQSACVEHKLYVEDIRAAYSDVHVFDEVVPISFKQRESATQGSNIYEYSSRSGIARAYKKIVKEIIDNGQNQQS